MKIRTLHAYVGMLIAPAVIFFATTGTLQIYSLHEAHAGYTPPILLEELGSVHKDQHFALGHRGAPERERPRPAARAPKAQHGHDDSKGDVARKAHVATDLLKAFFAAVAMGLIFSTILGVWMALRQSTRRRTHLVLLLIGTLVPLMLAFLTM